LLGHLQMYMNNKCQLSDLIMSLLIIHTTHTCFFHCNKVIYTSYYSLFIRTSPVAEQIKAKQSILLHLSTCYPRLNEFPGGRGIDFVLCPENLCDWCTHQKLLGSCMPFVVIWWCMSRYYVMWHTRVCAGIFVIYIVNFYDFY
jgi:hypothetical protein